MTDLERHAPEPESHLRRPHRRHHHRLRHAHHIHHNDVRHDTARNPGAPPITGFARRDATGRLIAGENIDAPIHTASLAKVATLYGALDQLKRNGQDVAGFVVDHHAAIANMMNCSDPAHYNQAAVEVARAAAERLQISPAGLMHGVNQSLAQLHINNEHMSGLTHIADPRGGVDSVSTPRDLSLLMHKAKSDFPEVFQNRNAFRPEIFNQDGPFIKPGQIDGVRTAMGVNRDGGTMAAGIDDRKGHHLQAALLDRTFSATLRQAQSHSAPVAVRHASLDF